MMIERKAAERTMIMTVRRFGMIMMIIITLALRNMQHDAVDKSEGFRARCVLCGVSYARSNIRKFLHIACNGEPTRKRVSIPPPTLTSTSNRWHLVRHGGARHDYEVLAGRDTRCRTCGANWKWKQRHALASMPCRGTHHAQHAWREDRDQELPLERNGHFISPVCTPSMTCFTVCFVGGLLGA